ncbi:MAG: hypothetical protein R2939_10250 [Kofleriaceae bacterium]
MNRTTRVLLLSLTTCLAAACGGDGGSSGVDSSKTIGSLSISEQMELCEWTNDQQPTEPFMCGGETIEPEDPADCSAAAIMADPVPTDCMATVGQYEACLEAVNADLCAESLPAVCEPLFACFG